ncbi:hypothetical protein [Streptomyces sp. NPDC002790]|uniref:hypothetical protein n=1 Tax=Streptomyces sp. NPDC002790 TaxID=3154431 RepID=UPI00332741F9
MPLPEKGGKDAEPGASGTPVEPKKRRSENAPDSRGVQNKKDEKKSKGRKRGPGKADDPKEPEEKHSIVGDTVDKYLPGASKYLPYWAKPIVHDVKKRSVDPDAVEAFLAQDGTLVVHAVLDPKKKGHGFGAFAAYTEGAGADDSIEMVLTVEDPSYASVFNPTTVTTIAVSSDSSEPVTNTAEVYSPLRADNVAKKTVSETVKEASSSAEDPEA